MSYYIISLFSENNISLEKHYEKIKFKRQYYKNLKEFIYMNLIQIQWKKIANIYLE